MSNIHEETPAPTPQQPEDDQSLLCDEEDLFDFPPLDAAFEDDDPFLDIDPFADPDAGPDHETLVSPAAGEDESGLPADCLADSDGEELGDRQDSTDDAPDISLVKQPGENAPPAQHDRASDSEACIPAAVTKRRPQAVQALIALALVVNLSLVAVVWKTSFGLEQSLDGMRADLGHAAQERELQQALLLAQATPREPLAAAPDETTGERTLLADSTSTDPARLALQFARQELADGQLAFARRRLYRLLCELDHLGSDAGLEADARFLIAESYTLAAGVSTSIGAVGRGQNDHPLGHNPESHNPEGLNPEDNR